MVDIGSRTQTDMLMTIFFIIESAILNAIIFGSFATYTEELKEEENQAEEEFDTANKVMRELDLTTDVSEVIRQYISNTRSYQAYQN